MAPELRRPAAAAGTRRRAPPRPTTDRYRDLPAAALPATECLADVVARMVPYWEDAIAADLRAFGGVLVVAHGNSIRALVKYLKDIPDDEIVGLEMPTGVPWWFRFDDRLELVEDRQLGDPEAIKAADGGRRPARRADPPDRPGPPGGRRAVPARGPDLAGIRGRRGLSPRCAPAPPTRPG